MPDYDVIDTWIFDLDNTLYPLEASLFVQVCDRIEAYVGRFLGLEALQARTVQKDFFHKHGTTLRGLMVEHDADPHDYLAFVHDIDLSAVHRDDRLRGGLERLEGRRLIFTNADEPYARRVLDRLGVEDLFEAVHDVHASGYIPKPRQGAYDALLLRHDVDPARSVFVEDMACNLAPAKALGMTTVWIDNGSDQGAGVRGGAHVDHSVQTIHHWLDMLHSGDPAGDRRP